MQVNVNIRVDEEIKRQAEELFEKLGLTMSSAINVFLRRAIMSEGIPFMLNAKKELSPGEKAILECQNISKNNGNDSLTLEEINDEIKAARHGK